MKMQDRIKMIRKELGMTQAEFGVSLGFSATSAASWEKKDAQEPSQLAKGLMRRTFRINIHWLETGEGEMFEPADPHSDAQRIAEAVSASPAVQSLLAAWEQLDENGRAVFEDYVRAFVADYRQREADRTTAAYQRILDDAESNSEASPSDAV